MKTVLNFKAVGWIASNIAKEYILKKKNIYSIYRKSNLLVIFMNY